MAQYPAVQKPISHVRSISLPAKSHPLISTVEENLQRLKASLEVVSSSSASSICLNLCGLRDLYESVNDFIQSPLTQQSLFHEQNVKWAEQVLDGSLRFLDVCATTRDVLAQIKESVQELQSSLRRKKSGKPCLADEVGNYMRSRKKIDKMVSKCTLILKESEKIRSRELSCNNSSLIPIMGLLLEVEDVSVSVLKSLLTCILSRPSPLVLHNQDNTIGIRALSVAQSSDMGYEINLIH